MIDFLGGKQQRGNEGWVSNEHVSLLNGSDGGVNIVNFVKSFFVVVLGDQGD